MNRKWLYAILFISITINVVVIAYAGTTWLVKISSDEARLTIYKDDFTRFYEAMITLQMIQGNLSRQEVLDMANRRETIKQAIRAFTDYYLLLIDGSYTRRKINYQEVKRKAKKVLPIIEQQIYLYEYITKIILPTVRVSRSEVRKLFNKYKKKAKNPKLLEQLIRERLRMQKALKKLQERLVTLRDNYSIRTNKRAIRSLRFR